MRTTTEMNLTSGNLFLKMFKFAIPLMMTSIFQLLYTSIDLWTVTKYGGGTLSMTAIGSNNALINLVLTVLLNMSTGSAVAISIAKGSNDRNKADRVLHTSYFLAIFGGIIFGILGFIVCPYILKFMDTPDSIYDNALLYLRIYFLGTPFVTIFNFGSQMLRSLGDSKRPLYILMISGIINVIFDLFFVIAFKMDVSGVAIATVISQMISAVLVTLWFIYNKLSFANLDLKRIRIYKEELNDILKVGIPAGLQGLAFCIPNLLIQSSLYSINDYYIDGVLITKNEIISGSSASNQIEGYIFFMLDCFAVSTVAFAGQNFGARKKDNIKKSYWCAVSWMLIFQAISMTLTLAFPYFFLRIFIKESEDININAALLAGKERLTIMTITYFLDGWMDINGCYLRGIKKAVPPAIVTAVGCSGTRILFLLTIFKMEKFHTIFWLYAAFPISWLLVNLTYLILVPIYEKEQFKLIEGKEEINFEPKPEM